MLVEAVGGLLELWTGYVAVCLRAADGWGAIGAPPSSNSFSSHMRYYVNRKIMEGSWKKQRSWLVWWFRLQPSSHSSLQQVIVWRRWTGCSEVSAASLERPLCRCSSVRRTLLAGVGCFGAGEPDRRSSGWEDRVVPSALGAGSEWGGKVALGRGGDRQVDSKASSFLAFIFQPFQFNIN